MCNTSQLYQNLIAHERRKRITELENYIYYMVNLDRLSHDNKVLYKWCKLQQKLKKWLNHDHDDIRKLEHLGVFDLV